MKVSGSHAESDMHNVFTKVFAQTEGSWTPRKPKSDSREGMQFAFFRNLNAKEAASKPQIKEQMMMRNFDCSHGSVATESNS